MKLQLQSNTFKIIEEQNLRNGICHTNNGKLGCWESWKIPKVNYGRVWACFYLLVSSYAWNFILQWWEILRKNWLTLGFYNTPLFEDEHGTDNHGQQAQCMLFVIGWLAKKARGSECLCIMLCNFANTHPCMVIAEFLHSYIIHKQRLQTMAMHADIWTYIKTYRLCMRTSG